jgi:hypothetical protein
VNEDVTASAYAFDPLLKGQETIILHVVPPRAQTNQTYKFGRSCMIDLQEQQSDYSDR